MRCVWPRLVIDSLFSINSVVSRISVVHVLFLNDLRTRLNRVRNVARQAYVLLATSRPRAIAKWLQELKNDLRVTTKKHAVVEPRAHTPAVRVYAEHVVNTTKRDTHARISD